MTETSTDMRSSGVDTAPLQHETRAAVIIPALLGLAIVALDQFSKIAMVGWLREGEVVPVVPGFFNLTLAYNRGTAFGMFSQLPDGVRLPVLAIATLGALALVISLLMSKPYRSLYPRAALSLVLAGAVGNIIDRVQAGKVTDFLDVFVGSYHWPTFNVADSAICVGVGLLFLFRPKPVESSTLAEDRVLV